MRKIIIENKTNVSGITGYVAEPGEAKIARMTQLKQPIEGGGQIAFTERKEGVKPEYDIRTDKFDIAMEMMDKVYASKEMTKQEGENLKESVDTSVNTED